AATRERPLPGMRTQTAGAPRDEVARLAVVLDWGARLSTAGSAPGLARPGAGLVGSAPQAPHVDWGARLSTAGSAPGLARPGAGLVGRLRRCAAHTPQAPLLV